MRRIFIALTILLALGNTADAKNYITLESPTGNTIVDETGKWILGPYKDLHVNYIIDFGENYAYASFYDNGQKRYINLIRWFIYRQDMITSFLMSMQRL